MADNDAAVEQVVSAAYDAAATAINLLGEGPVASWDQLDEVTQSAVGMALWGTLQAVTTVGSWPAATAAP